MKLQLSTNANPWTSRESATRRHSVRRCRRLVRSLCLAALLTAATRPAAAIELPELQNLIDMKASVYQGIGDLQADEIAAGTGQPIIHVSTGENLPTLWLHFRVLEDQVDALASAAQLPAGLSLSKISVAKGESPRHYYVTVSITEVGGDRQGLRAEWTTYVTSATDPLPRTYLLEVQTSEPTLEPVNLATDTADLLEYTVENGVVNASVVSGSSSFSVSFELPAKLRRRRVHRQWNTATDTVYWPNGVTDRVYYNGLLANRDLAYIRHNSVQIDDQTVWAPFLRPQPRRVYVLQEQFDYAIRPWTNITDPALDLDPDFRANLIATKASVFSALESQRALDVAQGLANPFSEFLLEPTPQSIFLVFKIKPGQRQALADAIPLPEGFELARMKTVRGSGRRHIVVLNIYEATGLAPGFRAEWSVFVTRNQDPVPYYMVIEAQSSVISLDSVNLFTLPAPRFDYTLTDGVLDVDIEADGYTFQASIPIPQTARRSRTTFEWTEANNRIYWGNGVYDRIYYNGLQADTEMIRLRRKDVTVDDASRWAPYLDLSDVLVFEDRVEFIASPWYNLDDLLEEIR